MVDQHSSSQLKHRVQGKTRKPWNLCRKSSRAMRQIRTEPQGRELSLNSCSCTKTKRRKIVKNQPSISKGPLKVVVISHDCTQGKKKKTSAAYRILILSLHFSWMEQKGNFLSFHINGEVSPHSKIIFASDNIISSFPTHYTAFLSLITHTANIITRKHSPGAI